MSRIADARPLVQALIAAGVHQHAVGPNGQCGMSAEEYTTLWPTEVNYPAGYAERYPHLLLVDQTVPTGKLVECVEADFYAKPNDCRVQPGIPECLLGSDGAKLTRAVVFWGYERNLGRSVVDCRLEASAIHIPLVHTDGLWLMIEHRDGILRRHAIDLPGSSCDGILVPGVSRFGNTRPHFYASHVDSRPPDCGSGFRGSKVTPVP